MSDKTNHWRSLTYHDPAKILIRLRELELTLPPNVDPKVGHLRTPGLKKYREWRDAALFTYGMGLAQGSDIGYATDEAADYDFVTAWLEGDQQHFCPVQLKELVSAELNPQASLDQLLSDVASHAQPTNTVLAIRLNRAGLFDPASIRLPPLGFKQVWYFGTTSPDSKRWMLIGDAKAQPRRFDFDYPEKASV